MLGRLAIPGVQIVASRFTERLTLGQDARARPLGVLKSRVNCNVVAIHPTLNSYLGRVIN